ncbi:MAG: DUF790 family protein, partial [Thermoplasmata archaeon]
MLTKELLVVTKRKPNIHPKFREPEKYRDLVLDVIDRYEIGKKKKEIEEGVSELESHGNFKLVRGLSKLLERKAKFGMDSPVEPEKLRRSAFEEGYVTDDEERRQVLEKVAEEYGLSEDEVERYLWADREEEMVLQFLEDVDGIELLKEYNLSLAQTLLFDAVELEFNASENFQQIFRMIKYFGLIYNVDEDLKVNVTGPAALFKKTRKYGTSFAKLLPHIMKAEEWEISAQIETEVSGEKRIYEFNLDSGSCKEGLFPELGEDSEKGEKRDEETEKYPTALEIALSHD